MGKKDGFMLYSRAAAPAADPLKRIASFDEFRTPLSDAKRREQAARCMNCGVPFCQTGEKIGGMFTGCPLHNLIPEWNDMLWLGNPRHALDRLLKTNCFPEFTGRVCPALCEAACTCGLNGESVTVHDNELYIIETAYAQGWMQPRPPRVRSGKRVAIVGSGPSGLAAAQTLNRRGHSVTVYERSDRPGGLLTYGIPNMKLDKRVVERRIRLMEAEGVRFVTETPIDTAEAADALRRENDAVVLCCGANRPRDLNLPGRDAQGVHFAVEFLTAATKRLLDGAPAIDAKEKQVVIVGGGDTGNDCVGTAIRQGCTGVTQLEMMPCPPEHRMPGNDWPEWPRVLKTDYGQQEAIACFGSDPRLYQTTVKEFLKNEAGQVCAAVISRLESRVMDGRRAMVPTGEEFTLECDLVLIAAGFTGCEKYVAEAFGVDLTPRGTVADTKYATSQPKVFACGDMRRGQSLVVWALREGRDTAAVVDESLMGYTNL